MVLQELGCVASSAEGAIDMYLHTTCICRHVARMDGKNPVRQKYLEIDSAECVQDFSKQNRHVPM